MNPTVKIHLQNGTHFNTYMYQVGTQHLCSMWMLPVRDRLQLKQLSLWFPHVLAWVSISVLMALF